MGKWARRLIIALVIIVILAALRQWYFLAHAVKAT